MLGKAGLIRAKKVGRERIYELHRLPAQVEAANEETRGSRAFWESALGAFKRYLEENHNDSRMSVDARHKIVAAR